MSEFFNSSLYLSVPSLPSFCLSLSLPDVCLRQVSVHLRPGQAETLLPAAAALPVQTGSGLLPKPPHQGHLQALTEEAVDEER